MKLKELRKLKNVTQIEVAQAIGVTPQVLSRYEREDREADYKTLCKLADYFNVSVDELLGRTPDQQLFDNAKIERPEILEKFEHLMPRQQEQIMEQISACIEFNEELKARGIFAQYYAEDLKRARLTVSEDF